MSHGDRIAFTEFYRRYEQMILAYFSRRVADPEMTADLCAETFAAALVGARGYRPEHDTAAPWLFGIARNQLNNSLRKRRIQASARLRLGMREPLVLDDQDLERIKPKWAQETSIACAARNAPGRAARRGPGAHLRRAFSYAEMADRLECSQLVARPGVSAVASRA